MRSARIAAASTSAGSRPPRTPTTDPAPRDEGLSYIDFDGQRVLLKEAIETSATNSSARTSCASTAAGTCSASSSTTSAPSRTTCTRGEADAPRVGRKAKPEAYYFPPQYNFKDNNFPYTFMGLEPGTTHDDVRRCLERWNEGDNGILYHSKAYKLKPGTGWQIDPGILHAPGSLVTYEPQVNSDVFGMFQSMVEGRAVPWDLLVKDVPHGAPSRSRLHHRHARLGRERRSRIRQAPAVSSHRSVEERRRIARTGWSTRRRHYSAKELTVFPGRSVVIRDAAAYGLIVVQGWGSVGKMEVETPSLIRFGEMTKDELFVSAAAAQQGRRRDQSQRQGKPGDAEAFRPRESRFREVHRDHVIN